MRLKLKFLILPMVSIPFKKHHLFLVLFLFLKKKKKKKNNSFSFIKLLLHVSLNLIGYMSLFLGFLFCSIDPGVYPLSIQCLDYCSYKRSLKREITPTSFFFQNCFNSSSFCTFIHKL